MAPARRRKGPLVIAASLGTALLVLCSSTGYQNKLILSNGWSAALSSGDRATTDLLQLEPSSTKLKVPITPTVYVVTPTYRRPTQIPDLLRVAHSLMLATDVFWVLVEDATQPSKAVSRLLRDSGLPHVHLLGPCPPQLRNRSKGRGVSPRRAGLAWLNANASLPGVLYFADDDNTYDHRLFDEIRWTRGVSVFPVGSMKVTGVSSPIVVDDSVVDFHDPYRKGRRFAVDMAGFAVNLRLVLNNSRVFMPHRVGRQETEFLESLNVSISDLEPLCEGATKVLVWHTQTTPSVFPSSNRINRAFWEQKTNLKALLHYVND